MTHITKERAKCPHCFDIGYDASGYACTCIDTPAAPVQPVADAWMHKDGRMTDAKAKTARVENFHGWRPMAFIDSPTPPAAQPAPCTWTQSPDPNMPDTYHATCGAVWTFTEGGPGENNVRFCPECGKKVTKGGSA